MIVTRRSAGDNFRAGRVDLSGRIWEPDAIVIHVTEGHRASVRNWFANDGADVSAHYMVTTDGAIDQFVDEADTAFHAGRVLSPTARIVRDRPGVNPNVYTIGIEHEGTGHAELTAKQRATSLELIDDIRRRWPQILADRRHIIGHHEVYAAKTCPGRINVDLLVAEMRGSTKRPVVVWSSYLQDWLLVVRVTSDIDWEFVTLTAARKGLVTTGTVPLSSMPLVVP
jgi:N-acetylmuramoyl-L-alanine amidase